MIRLLHRLPSPPVLCESHLREIHAPSTRLGPISALVPAADPFLCRDSHAPALVLVPGMGMDGLGFLRQLPLGAVSQLHLYQTPNHVAPGERGIEAFAGVLEEYVRSTGLEEHPGGLILGGCSMGGAISLAAAIRGKIRIKGLLLIGSFGTSKHLQFHQLWGAPLAWIAPHSLLRKFAPHAIARTGVFGQVTADEAKWLATTKLPRNNAYYGRAAAALTRMDQIPNAKKVSVPTLVLHGTHDRVLPYKAGQELAAVIPMARLVTFQEAGHALFFTHPDEVNTAIAEFVTTLRS